MSSKNRSKGRFTRRDFIRTAAAAAASGGRCARSQADRHAAGPRRSGSQWFRAGHRIRGRHLLLPLHIAMTPWIAIRWTLHEQ